MSVIVNTKIQPLVDDLRRILPGEFLASTAFKRWMVEKKLDENWNEFVSIVRQNRNVVVIGYDHDAGDARDALGYLINRIFEQQKTKLPKFVYELLEFYSEEKSEHVDASNIKKDLYAAGYSKKTVSKFDNFSDSKLKVMKETENNSQMVKPVTNKKKTPMVFISHSHGDEDFVKALVNLLEDIGLGAKTMFCSSVREYGIKLNGDIFETIRELFLEHELYVIFVHSPRFYSSAVSLNEMGAAWVLKTDFCSFLTNDMSYNQMKGVVNNTRISIKVDDKDAPSLLNDLYKQLTRLFVLQEMDMNKWERKRDQFITLVRNIKYNEVKKTIEEKNVDMEYKKLQIAKMKAEAEDRHKAYIRGNIVKDYQGKRTLKIFNAGQSTARNVLVEWLNESDRVIVRGEFYNIGELTPQNARSYTLLLSIGCPDTMNLRYTWDDDFAVGNKLEETLQL